VEQLTIAVGRFGIKPSEFWELTPYEFSLIVQYKNEELNSKYNEMLFLAWHIEALQRQKKLPKLDNILIKKKDKKKSLQESRKRNQLIEWLELSKKYGLKLPKKYR